MGTLADQLRKSQQLKPSKIEAAIFNYIRSIEKELTGISRERLNKDSKDIEGNPLGFYSRATEIITNGRKEEGTPFDLDDTGVFLKSLTVTVSNGVIIFGTSDPKTDDVLDNLLTKDIFGLSDTELNGVIKSKITPFLLTHIRKTLQ